jgi:hypothetical protein
MEPLMLLAMLIGIVFIGYAVVNVIFKVVNDLLTFLEENRTSVLVAVAVLIVLWFAFHS